jgi:cyclopropane fatty-acyl-phospholipid synthase-like methyltransferase
LRVGIDDSVLDFGCAKGYMVKAFRLLHREAWGVEVSKYALDNAPEDTKPFLSLIKPYAPISKRYDWIVAKDVFEHIPYDKIDEVLNNLFLTSRRGMFALIPAGDGSEYYAPDSNKDTTHIIKEDLLWWADKFKKAGYVVSQSTYNIDHITRPAWRQWERAIGFYVLTRWHYA